MRKLILLGFIGALTACPEASGTTQTPDPNNPTVQDPIKPTEPPKEALQGLYVGEMSGKLLGESTYKISIGLNETTDGKFVYSGPTDPNRNYYQLWDLKLAPLKNNAPNYDGYATGTRDGSVLNLALPINYKDCSLNLKAYVSTDSKTLDFFATKQTVNCGINLDIALKPFTMKHQ
jgi:hypothetical protein